MSKTSAGPPAPLLGVFGDEHEFKEAAYALMPGDMLLFYTDGITEARNPQGIMLGNDQTHSLVAKLHGRAAREACDHLADVVNQFQNNDPIYDITLLAIRRIT